MAQLMPTNIINPPSFNLGFQNQNDTNVLPSVHAPVGSMAQGMFHDMYRFLNINAAAAYRYGSSFVNNACFSRPQDLTRRQTDSVAAASSSATTTKSGDDHSPCAVVVSMRNDSGRTVAANEAAEFAYQSSLQYSAIQGLLQLQTDSIAYQLGRSSSHAVLGVDGRNDGIYNVATRSTESSPWSGEDVSAQHLPMFTEEQLAMEQAMMTKEERAETLSDLFGKHCVVDIHQSKKARRDFNHKTIEFLVQQMRRELAIIPEDEKRALVEAQTKCREDEFSDARLERFLRCEGMNAKVRLEVFLMCAIIPVAKLKRLIYFGSVSMN
jgi:hypothetical protein